MIINNINPVLFSLGPFEVRYYGLVYAIGFLCVYFFLRYTVNKKILNISEDELDNLLIFLMLGSIIGARLFDVFIYNLPTYRGDFTQIFRIWEGGMAYHGGIIGTLIVVYIFSKKYKFHFYKLMDLLTIPAALFLALGKIANYTNSELYGKASDSSFCVVFQKIDSICRHPVQIYEAISVFIIFIVLIYMFRKYYLNNSHSNNQNNRHEGEIFWTFMIIYGATRFIITFFRDEPVIFGLNVGQWMSLIIIVISTIFLYKIRQNNHKS